MKYNISLTCEHSISGVKHLPVNPLFNLRVTAPKKGELDLSVKILEILDKLFQGAKILVAREHDKTCNILSCVFTVGNKYVGVFISVL